MSPESPASTDARQPRSRQSDIAAAAGVSRATVSMVLNGRTGKGAAISADTRARVLEVATRLGYVGNPSARNLAGGRNRLLGVYTFAPVFPTESADFYHPFLVGVEREAELLGYDLVLFTGAGPGGERSIYRDNVNRLRIADGCILLGGDSDRFELDRLVEDDFSFVFIGRREVPGREIAYVSADYVAATVDIVTRLAELGHRKVAYLGAGLDFEPLVDRVEGFRRGVERCGLDSDPSLNVVANRESLELAHVRALLAAGATAFVIENRGILERLAELADELGLHAPDDYSMVLLGPSTEGVTGLSMPRREMGGHAVRMLVDMLGDASLEQRRRIELPCAIAAGGTMGSPPAIPRSVGRS